MINVKEILQWHCYVVVEIKTGKFDSSYAGQLGTYVVAVNHQMKTKADNPTLGLLICKDMDKVEAQYALESTSQPLGISSYELSKLIPEEFKGRMPTIEEIEAEREKRLNLIENEADRAKFEKEVKELINQHKDIVKLISFDKRYVYIEQIEQQDLFYQNPITQVKISRNAIDIIKKYIEEWSK